MNLYDLLMEAAQQLPERFTAEDLTVAAHRLYPDRMGMTGYPQHPDHHRATAALYGARGLIARGVLTKIGGALVIGPKSIAATAEELAMYADKPWVACLRYMNRTGLGGHMAHQAFRSVREGSEVQTCGA